MERIHGEGTAPSAGSTCKGRMQKVQVLKDDSWPGKLDAGWGRKLVEGESRRCIEGGSMRGTCKTEKELFDLWGAGPYRPLL
jgi:hypothetical protein